MPFSISKAIASLTAGIATIKSTFVFSDLHKTEVGGLVEIENTMIEKTEDRINFLKERMEVWEEGRPERDKLKNQIIEEEQILLELGDRSIIYYFRDFGKILFVDSNLVEMEFLKAYTAFVYNIAIALIENANFRLEMMTEFLDKILPTDKTPIDIESVNAGLLNLINQLNKMSLAGYPTATTIIHHLDFEEPITSSLMSNLIIYLSENLSSDTKILVTGRIVKSGFLSQILDQLPESPPISLGFLKVSPTVSIL